MRDPELRKFDTFLSKLYYPTDPKFTPEEIEEAKMDYIDKVLNKIATVEEPN